MGSKSPSALAAFSHNWIGGDIHGLSSFAGTLYGYGPQITGVAKALDGKVKQIVGDAGWQGDAASGFSKAWDHDSLGANALAKATDATGDVVDWLAVNLAKIESALEKAASEAQSHGVPIGGNGEPVQACLSDQTAEKWRQSYQSFYGRCMIDATNARNEAAGALQGLGNTILGKDGKDGGDKGGLLRGDYNAMGDVLAGFLGANTRYRGFVDLRVGHLRSQLADAKTKAIENARQADGKFGKWSAEDRGAFQSARGDLTSAEGDLTAAKNGEGFISKLAGYSPSDISALSKSLDGVGGAAGDIARAADGIPFVDIAAAGLGTYFSAQEDIEKGVPAPVAYTGEAAGNVAALGAGTAVGIGATGLVAGLGAGTFVAGGAGVLAGGVVAYGVGDFAHNLIDENWGADFNKYGTWGGLGHGIADSAVKTGQDFENIGKSIWHGISSIF